MATPDYDQVLKNNQEAASLSAKAAQEARDAYTQIINTKAVGTNGQLRALSAADTLADAPVGDAARLRNSIGAQEAGKCIVNEEQVSTAGLSGGDLAKPYFRKVDGNVCWIQPSTSMMALDFGGEAWQVRQRIGLGNDDGGRTSMGLGSGDRATFKSVNAQGCEVTFLDLHKLEGDSADYQVRLICDGDGHAKFVGKVSMESLTLDAGGYAVGSTVMAACYTNANIGFDALVSGTELMPCSASGWNKNGIRLSGTWRAVCECGGRYDLIKGPASIGLWRRES